MEKVMVWKGLQKQNFSSEGLEDLCLMEGELNLEDPHYTAASDLKCDA